MVSKTDPAPKPEASSKTSTTTKAAEVNEIDEYLEIPDIGENNGNIIDENSIKPDAEIGIDVDYSIDESDISVGSSNEDGSGEGDDDDHTIELSQLSSQTKRVGEAFEIECTLRGPAKRTLVWMKKDDESKELKTEVIKSNANLVTNKLIFESLTRKDNGVYSCYAQERSYDVLNLNLEVKGSVLIAFKNFKLS